MNIKYFKKWLSDRGCEILPISNPYEAVRFKGRQVGVLYTSGKTNSPFTDRAIVAFMNNSKWDGAPINPGRHPGYKKEKKQLIEGMGLVVFTAAKN